MQILGPVLAAALLLLNGLPRGTTHEVKMVQDGKAYRFEPAELTIKAGDQVKFVNASGGPHNAAFDGERIPDEVERVLGNNMPTPMSPLAGPLLTRPNESYTVSFAGVKPGTYPFFCMPHVAAGMKGTITVQ